MLAPRPRYRRSTPCPRTEARRSPRRGPRVFVDALGNIDVEPGVSGSRALDQALDCIGLSSMLGQQRLGAPDGEIVHERRSRLAGLDQGSDTVHRLRKRGVLGDGYAGMARGHVPMVALRCNTVPESGKRYLGTCTLGRPSPYSGAGNGLTVSASQVTL